MKMSILILSLSMLSAYASQKTVQEVVKSVMATDLKEVMKRHKEEMKVNEWQARNHERELKRFLACCIVFPTKEFGMCSKEVDSVWHNFILFTEKYIEFCSKNAGRYLHHSPTIGKQDRETNIQKAQDFAACYRVLFNENPPVDIWPLTDPNMESWCLTPCNKCFKCTQWPLEFGDFSLHKKLEMLGISDPSA
jgi:hypothetical protein